MSIVSTSQEICYSPLNNSVSKQQYSFSKGTRFTPLKKPECATAFYDLPPVVQRRSTSLGYGTKSDFTKLAPKGNPPPVAYDVRMKPGIETSQWSFGVGRDKASVGSVFQGKAVPGPGAYQVPDTTKSNIAYSLRPMTVNPEVKTTAADVPGPGTYKNYDSLNKSGKYFYSKFHDSGCGIIPPARSKRFRDDLYVKHVPGPGAYDPKVGTDPKGEYIESRYKNNASRSFSQSVRGKDPKPTYMAVPGPGSYRLPSDFGYYEPKVSAVNRSFQHVRTSSAEHGKKVDQSMQQTSATGDQTLPH